MVNFPNIAPKPPKRPSFGEALKLALADSLGRLPGQVIGSGLSYLVNDALLGTRLKSDAELQQKRIASDEGIVQRRIEASGGERFLRFVSVANQAQAAAEASAADRTLRAMLEQGTRRTRATSSTPVSVNGGQLRAVLDATAQRQKALLDLARTSKDITPALASRALGLAYDSLDASEILRRMGGLSNEQIRLIRTGKSSTTIYSLPVAALQQIQNANIKARNSATELARILKKVAPQYARVLGIRDPKTIRAITQIAAELSAKTAALAQVATVQVPKPRIALRNTTSPREAKLVRSGPKAARSKTAIGVVGSPSGRDALPSPAPPHENQNIQQTMRHVVTMTAGSADVKKLRASFQTELPEGRRTAAVTTITRAVEDVSKRRNAVMDKFYKRATKALDRAAANARASLQILTGYSSMPGTPQPALVHLARIMVELGGTDPAGAANALRGFSPVDIKKKLDELSVVVSNVDLRNINGELRKVPGVPISRVNAAAIRNTIQRYVAFAKREKNLLSQVDPMTGVDMQPSRANAWLRHRFFARMRMKRPNVVVALTGNYTTSSLFRERAGEAYGRLANTLSNRTDLLERLALPPDPSTVQDLQAELDRLIDAQITRTFPPLRR